MSLPRMNEPRPDVEMRVWIVSHDGTTDCYAIPATSAIMAALAYCRLMRGRLTLEQERRVWVRCDHDGKLTGQSYPLMLWTAESTRNWLAADSMRAHLLNASFDGATKRPLGHTIAR